MSEIERKIQASRERYRQLLELTQIDLSNWDPRTKPSMEGKQNAAKTEIVFVKEELAHHILRNSRIMIVKRDFEAVDEVIEAAKGDPSRNVVLDYLALEKGMYREIFPIKTMSLTFNSIVLNKMNLLAADVGHELGAISMPMMTVAGSAYGTVSSKEEMIDKIERTMEFTYGYDLKKLFLQARIAEKVLERVDQDSVNVVLINIPDGFVNIARSFAARSQVLDLAMLDEDVPVKQTKKRAKRVKTPVTKEAVAPTVTAPSSVLLNVIDATKLQK